jgi:hypothetical protein
MSQQPAPPIHCNPFLPSRHPLILSLLVVQTDQTYHTVRRVLANGTIVLVAGTPGA